jgi:hypothetical protein
MRNDLLMTRKNALLKSRLSLTGIENAAYRPEAEFRLESAPERAWHPSRIGNRAKPGSTSELPGKSDGVHAFAKLCGDSWQGGFAGLHVEPL